MKLVVGLQRSSFGFVRLEVINLLYGSGVGDQRERGICGKRKEWRDRRRAVRVNVLQECNQRVFKH